MTESLVLGSVLEDLLELGDTQLADHLLVVVEASTIQLLYEFCLFHVHPLSSSSYQISLSAVITMLLMPQY